MHTWTRKRHVQQKAARAFGKRCATLAPFFSVTLPRDIIHGGCVEAASETMIVCVRLSRSVGTAEHTGEVVRGWFAPW
eukprot:1194633-Prorocentrum_minimum.AAC.8